MFSKYLESSVLSIIQGISEFIPVSSSAHLLLTSELYEFSNSSLQLDICLHLGSLIAIIFYFRNDLKNILDNKNIFLLMLVGSIPLVTIGYFFYYTGLIDYFRNLKVIAWATLIFGILLYFADNNKKVKNFNNDLNFKNILIIGFMQVLAIIPGVSRSGIIITASRFLNFDRIDSTKIAFYLSIPALTGASVLSIKDILKSNIEFDLIYIFATLLSFLASYFTIKFFLIYLKKYSLKFFVYYRIFLALILFLIIYY